MAGVSVNIPKGKFNDKDEKDDVVWPFDRAKRIKAVDIRSNVGR